MYVMKTNLRESYHGYSEGEVHEGRALMHPNNSNQK